MERDRTKSLDGLAAREHEGRSYLPKLRKFVGTAVLAVALVSPGLLRAQQQETDNAPQVQTQTANTNSGEKLTGSVVSTTQDNASGITEQAATKLTYNLGSVGSLLFVGGLSSKLPVVGVDQNGYDLGFMLESKDRTSWERVTILNDFRNLSYGFDLNRQLVKIGGIGLSLMGDTLFS